MIKTFKVADSGMSHSNLVHVTIPHDGVIIQSVNLAQPKGSGGGGGGFGGGRGGGGGGYGGRGGGGGGELQSLGLV